jgi:hypothetical protein
MSEWYADGLAFSCTQCGNCCTGPPGTVQFNRQEGRDMAVALGIDERVFYRRYAHKVDGRWSLIERLTTFGHDCVFLDRTSVPGSAVCGLYEARPAQCRTWPFWPENLRSPRAWAGAKRDTPCPGMDCGTVVPIEKIRIQRDTPLD